MGARPMRTCGAEGYSPVSSSSVSPAPIDLRSEPAQKTSPRPVKIATRSILHESGAPYRRFDGLAGCAQTAARCVRLVMNEKNSRPSRSRRFMVPQSRTMSFMMRRMGFGRR